MQATMKAVLVLACLFAMCSVIYGAVVSRVLTDVADISDYQTNSGSTAISQAVVGFIDNFYQSERRILMQMSTADLNTLLQ